MNKTDKHITSNNAHNCNHVNHEHLESQSNGILQTFFANLLQSIFLIAAMCIMVQMTFGVFKSFSIVFGSIILEAFPFVLLGVLVSGLIEEFVPKEKIAILLPKNNLVTVFLAAGLGFLFPVCECAIVPVVRRLLKKGIPVSAAVAYLLGGPIVNPLVALSTLIAYSFSWDMVIFRVVLGYFIASFTGLLFDFIMAKNPVVIENNHLNCSHTECSLKSTSFFSKIIHGLQHSAAEFYDIARFLIMGAFIAAVLQTLVPRSLFVNLAANSFVSIILMMFLAILLNLCSEADAFVAASFRPLGIPTSAQLAFMVLGPMLDIKLILMYLSVFTKRAIIVLPFLTILIVFTAISLFYFIIEVL
jgi:uncharacterized membrane protein YraQ (UPF0718 family)